MKTPAAAPRSGNSKNPGRTFRLFLLSPLLLALAACGNGNLFNGVGGNGTGTLQGAKTTALQYIANGNYSGAAGAISPYCPNNACPDTASANILTDSYIALGTASGSTYVAASSILVASSSGSYVGTNQIVSNLISLAQNGATASQTFNAIAQVVPCIQTNQCTSTGIADLLTALEVQINSGCTVSACDPNMVSMYALAAAVYVLANLQYQTGLTYISGTWELCTASGGGTSSCTSSLSTISLTTPSSSINNDCWLLFSGLSGASGACGTPTLPANPPSLASVVATIATTLGTSSVNLTNSLNQLLNAIITCNSACSTTNSSSTPTSVPNINFSTALSNYLKDIQTF